MESEQEQTLGKSPSEEEDTAMEDAHGNTKSPKDDSSDPDDSDDSDSDSEDEAQLKSDLQNLEFQLSNDPSNYDIHVQVFVFAYIVADFL